MKLFIRHIYKKIGSSGKEKKSSFYTKRSLKNYGLVVKVVVFQAESPRFDSPKPLLFFQVFFPLCVGISTFRTA